MGSNNTTSYKSEYNFNPETFYQDYQKTNIINFETNGAIYQRKNQEGNMFVLRKRVFAETQEQEYQYQKLVGYQGIKNQNLLKILSISSSEAKESMACGDSSNESVDVYLEWYLPTLYEDYEIRLKTQVKFMCLTFFKKNFYEEGFLQYLLYTIVQAMTTLNMNQMFHSDLRIQNIYLTNQKQPKIFPSILLTQETGLSKFLNRQEETRIAPEEFLAIHLKEYNNVDFAKADVFTFGMQMLSLASLQPLNECYNYQTLQIYSDQIDILFSIASQRYSKTILDVIRNMVRYDTNDRPNFIDLYKELQAKQSQWQIVTASPTNTSLQRSPIFNNVTLAETQIIPLNSSFNNVQQQQPILLSQKPMYQQQQNFISSPRQIIQPTVQPQIVQQPAQLIQQQQQQREFRKLSKEKRKRSISPIQVRQQQPMPYVTQLPIQQQIQQRSFQHQQFQQQQLIPQQRHFQQQMPMPQPVQQQMLPQQIAQTMQPIPQKFEQPMMMPQPISMQQTIPQPMPQTIPQPMPQTRLQIMQQTMPQTMLEPRQFQIPQQFQQTTPPQRQISFPSPPQSFISEERQQFQQQMPQFGNGVQYGNQFPIEEKVTYYREPSKLIMPPQIISNERMESIKRQLDHAPVFQMKDINQPLSSHDKSIPEFQGVQNTSRIYY